MTTDRWCLHLWGVPRVTGRDCGVSVPLVHNDALWLAYVVSNAPVGSARVASLVWPEVPGARAQNSLRQRLFRLRKATGARLVDTGETLAVASDLLVLAPPAESEIEADAAGWDQEFLASVDLDASTELGAWLAECRCAWHERRRDALAAIASRAESAGEIARALAYAQRLLAHDRLSEHAHRRLMRLHYLRGDRAAAVAAFESCERTLKDELGLKPDAETLALLDTFERSAATTLATRPPALPASLLRPPRTVGREAAMQQLRGTGGGGPRIALVVGEAGIGKTRLLQDFVAGSAPARVAYAHARPGDAGVPYGALQRLLAALDAASPAAARAALAAALAGGVTTLVFDDLHFADRASIECLRSLVDDDALAALRWVFAHRPLGAADEDAALLASLAEAEDAAWVALPPLAEAELGELVDSLHLPGADRAGLAAPLWRHTGGNPLYALETLRAAHAPGAPGAGALMLPRPQSIAHMIDRRLQRLSERALALGRVAAIAGADFGPALAEQALATPALLLAGAWAELEAADVLRGNAFAHDLVRDGMLRATPRPIAAHAHGQIAVFLEAQGAEPARVAAHWVEAGAHGKAGAAFLDAARRAQGLGRPREQARLLLQAAQAFELGGHEDDAVLARVDAVPPLLASDGLVQALELSEQLTRDHGDGARGGRAWTMRAVALIWSGRVVEAEAAGRLALERLRDTDAAFRMEASRTVALACGLRGSPQDGLDLMRPWIARLEGVGTLDDRILFCAVFTNLLLQADRPGEALQVADRHLALARQAGNRMEELTSLMNLGSANIRRGDIDEAIDLWQQAEALAPSEQQASNMAEFSRTLLGYALCGVGRYREGIERLEAAVAALSSGSQIQVMAENLLAPQWMQLGQPARAARALAGETVAVPAHMQAARLHYRALLAAPPEREAMLRRAYELAGAGPGDYVRLMTNIELARLEDADPAAERCGAVIDLALAKEYHPVAAFAAAVRLQAWQRGGRVERLATAVEQAEAWARRYRTPACYWPELMLSCFRAWLALDRSDAAARCLDDAFDWMQRVAGTNLPPYCRESFLERNPVNLALRAAVARRAARTP